MKKEFIEGWWDTIGRNIFLKRYEYRHVIL